MYQSLQRFFKYAYHYCVGDVLCRRRCIGIVAVTALSLGVLGYDKHLHMPSWCWIDPSTYLLSPVAWQYITGKAWEIICYFVIVGLYVPVKCKLRKQVSLRQGTLHMSSMQQFALVQIFDSFSEPCKCLIQRWRSKTWSGQSDRVAPNNPFQFFWCHSRSDLFRYR